MPRTISGVDNTADALTKILGRKRLLYLMKRFFNLSGPAALSALVKMMFRHNECESLGEVDLFFTR